jgi:hypothetical protein
LELGVVIDLVGLLRDLPDKQECIADVPKKDRVGVTICLFAAPWFWCTMEWTMAAISLTKTMTSS